MKNIVLTDLVVVFSQKSLSIAKSFWSKFHDCMADHATMSTEWTQQRCEMIYFSRMYFLEGEKILRSHF